MITIDCPFCSGDAHVGDGVEALVCDGCGVAVDLAPDTGDVLEVAA
jgi:hypothetical protein